MIENTIICGDCLEVMKDWPDNCVDLVLTDPPYGINLDNDWQNKVHTNQLQASNVASGGFDNDNGELTAEMFLKFDNRIIFGFPYLYDSKATGWLVWDKEPMFKGRSLTSPIEMAYSTVWAGFKAFRYLWSGYMRAPNAETKLGHPTQKPIALMLWLLEEYSNPNDLILDPFCGSGTTCVAAKMLGRRYIGIDISEEYCNIARQRLEAVDTGVPVKEQRKGQQPLFPKD